MNRKIVITQTPDQRVYFTSDTHFNHNRDFIYALRGYPDVRSMTDAIIDGINKVVRPTDHLFHLGDFCLNTDESRFNELLSRIHCQNIYTIFGNHNSPSWTIYQNEVARINDICKVVCYTGCCDPEIYPLRYRNLIFLGNYAEISVDGHFITLFHYPLLSWNKMKKSSWHLFGHVHGKLKLDGKRIDVGWDNFQKPVSFQELQKIMGNRPIISDGSHH